MFNILENHYMIDLPTNSADLAALILYNTYDWEVALDFIDSVAKQRKVIINKREVTEIIRKELGI